MHVVLSLTLGAGLLLTFLSLTERRPATAPADEAPGRPGRPASAAPGALAVRVAAAVASAAMVQLFLGWPALSAGAGIAGALLPSW